MLTSRPVYTVDYVPQRTLKMAASARGEQGAAAEVQREAVMQIGEAQRWANSEAALASFLKYGAHVPCVAPIPTTPAAQVHAWSLTQALERLQRGAKLSHRAQLDWVATQNLVERVDLTRRQRQCWSVRPEAEV